METSKVTPERSPNLEGSSITEDSLQRSSNPQGSSITKTSSLQAKTHWVKEQFKINSEKLKLGRTSGDFGKGRVGSSDDSAKALIYNAFGEIDFIGYGKNIAKYIAVEKDPKMDDIEKLMLEVWALEKPKLVITVSGCDPVESNSASNNNENLVKRIREGLIKAVKSTGAWIITDGTHNGVAELVGEAMKEFRRTSGLSNPAVAIGIAPWGCIKNRDSLVCKDSDTLNKERLYELEKPKLKQHYLDPYHSHFILLDDGSEMQFGTERKFRAELENTLAAHAKRETNMVESANSEPNSGPIVLIVFGGDITTLQTVADAMEKKIPAIIVKGSGGIADILANATEGNMNDYDKSVKTVLDDCKKQFKTPKGTKKYIKICIRHRENLSVYEYDSWSDGSNDFDVVMLKALLKANKDSVLYQIRLTLSWNRIDVAKSEIFSDKKKWMTVERDNRHSLMTTALLDDKADFVQLFLDHGVSLRQFLTLRTLLDLYNETAKKSLMIQELLPKKEITLKDVGNMMTKLIGDYFKFENTYEENKESMEWGKQSRNLFIWSILQNRQDMANLFWSEGRDAIATALIGNHICMELLKHPKNAELIDGIQEKDADNWSALAKDVLGECFSSDKRNTEELLVRKLSNWGDVTCMVIATNAYNQDFISLPACQSLIDHAWDGKQRVNESQTDDDKTSKKQKVKDNVGKEDNETQEEGTMKHKIINLLKKPYKWSKSPKGVAVYNLLSYLAFLAMFGYMMIVSFNPKFSVVELLLIIWVSAIFIEELRQFPCCMEALRGSLYMKWNKIDYSVYILSAWNMLDIACILLFFVGMILRSAASSATFETARVFLAIDFWLFGLRLLQIFCVFEKFGATLVMISRLIQDLVFFVLILLTFVISYGIASYSVLFPNTPISWDTIRAMIGRPYWNIYGELFLEDIEGEECTNGTAQQIDCPYPLGPTEVGRIAAPIMMGINMMIVNVLLLNLLIAMFSYTFKKVKDEETKHWLYQRFLFIHEFCTRPSFVPPFNLLFHVIYPIFFCGNFHADDSVFCPENSPADLDRWEERIAGAFYWNKSDKSTRIQRQDEQMEKVADVLSNIKSTLDEMKTTLDNPRKQPPSKDKMENVADDLSNIKSTLDEIKTTLDNPRKQPPSKDKERQQGKVITYAQTEVIVHRSGKHAGDDSEA